MHDFIVLIEPMSFSPMPLCSVQPTHNEKKANPIQYPRHRNPSPHLLALLSPSHHAHSIHSADTPTEAEKKTKKYFFPLLLLFFLFCDSFLIYSTTSPALWLWKIENAESDSFVIMGCSTVSHVQDRL
ncbi:hypothetical protein BD410DRAFT_55918 [Rickenella mellea]|uniref:Transmembrane protein n=1 Tax=Rickenella mellea TaxID=50990 RepID=A0A4R5XGA8_9AGAM|nr:hypothetical protein BD410DRAFT_55918 [Rickenella mellea]